MIILTGQGDEKTAVEFFHAGAYDYLLKTMDRGFGETLRLTIRELLMRRRLEREIEHEKRRSETILESLNQMVCTLDLDLADLRLEYHLPVVSPPLPISRLAPRRSGRSLRAYLRPI